MDDGRLFHASRAPQACAPPYSPYIALSDFYLFGKVKNRLIGKSIQNEHELFLEVTEILRAIPTTELRNVFRNCIRRLEQVIDTHGEYGSSTIFSHH
jgi:hypothetical protein